MTETNPVPGGHDFKSKCEACGAVTATSTGFDDWWAGNGHNPREMEGSRIALFRKETARRSWNAARNAARNAHAHDVQAAARAECRLLHIQCGECNEDMTSPMGSHECPPSPEEQRRELFDATRLQLYRGMFSGWHVGPDPVELGEVFS